MKVGVVIRLTLEEVLRFHGVESLSVAPEDLEFLRRSTERLVEENGEEWIIRHRGLLLDQYEITGTYNCFQSEPGPYRYHN